MTASHVAELAKELGMRPQFLMQQAADMARRLPEAMDRAVRETAPPLPQPARLLAERLQQFVATTTRKISLRLKTR